jgi:transposase
MKTISDEDPQDIYSLREIVRAQSLEIEKIKKEKELLQKEKETLAARIASFEEWIRLSKQRQFGASSEKAPGQGELFNEPEVIADSEDVIPQTDLPDDHGKNDTPAGKSNPKRKPLPPHLPRIEKVYELPETDRLCACGCALQEIGADTSEQFDFIPAKIQVIRHVRKKYACKACEDTIKSAPKPATFLPKSNASEATIATVIVAKFQDGIPLYRLSDILSRQDIDASRQTLSGWVLAAAERFESFVTHLEAQLFKNTFIQMDETVVQVLKTPELPDKSPTSMSYMWVRRGGPPRKRIILFDYAPSRSSEVPIKLLQNYKGALMTDGYEGYNAIVNKNGIIHLCCFAHARRKFVDAQKALAKNTKNQRIEMAINFIGKLYAIEREYANASPENRYKARQARSKPILVQFHQWLQKTQQEALPKGKLGEAVAYCMKYWEKLTRYTENGEWPIDNNATENSIRPFVVGRKAWLFSNTARGAQASARLYSIVETAKANGHDPYHYLTWLMQELPRTSAEDYERLMPWSVEPEAVRQGR